MTQGVGPFSTYDLNPPQLPSGETFNDCAKEDDTSELQLNPLTDPNSEEYNYLCSLAIATATVQASAIVSVMNGAVTSCLSPVQSVSGNLSAFSITNPSAGVTILEWTAQGENGPNQMLPPQRAQPGVSFTGVLGANTYAISATYVTGPNGHPAVQVTTVVGGALANLASTIGFQVTTF